MRSTLFALAAASLFATAAQAAPATYAIDPTHTFATFEIDHFGASTNRARFDKKSGNVQFDKAAKTGKVEVTLDMTSVNSGTAAFNKHLQSADIFNAEKFPEAKFVSDKFVFDGDKLKEVTGQLTLWARPPPSPSRPTSSPATKAPCCKSVKSAAATLKPPSTAPSGA
jgi:polyisoprenoid-binding protein YceI